MTGACPEAERVEATGPAEPHRGAGPANRRTRIVVLVAVGLGLLLRIWIVSSPLGPFDSDEAVAGLMGRRVLDGELRAFYWGQAYGATHEALLLALLFAVGVPTRLAMELVPVALTAATAVLVWRVGLRVFDRWSAALAGALFWTTSAVFVWQSTKERSFYATTLLAGVAVILLTLRLLDRPSLRDALLLGVAGGIGWHSSPNIAYLAGPALIWLTVEIVRRRDVALLRLSWAAGLGALAGALPWIWSNVASGGASLELASYRTDTTYLDRLQLFATQGFPYALGVQTPHEPVRWPSMVLYVVALAGFVAALVRLPGRAWGIGLGLLLGPFIFAAFPPSWFVGEPRYLSFMWPFVVLVVAGALGTLRRHRTTLLLLAAIAAASVAGTALMVHRSHSSLVADYSPGDLEPLVEELRAGGDDRVFADYWIAYRLALATDERILASPLQTVRNPPYEAEVRAAPNPPYVFFHHSCYEEHFQQFLLRRDVEAARTTVGRFSVFRLRARVLPEEALTDWASARGLARRQMC